MNHPGPELKQMLTDRRMTVVEFSQRVGCSDVFVYLFMGGKRGIGPDMSIKFGRVLGIDGGHFYMAWKKYQLEKAKERMKG